MEIIEIEPSKVLTCEGGSIRNENALRRYYARAKSTTRELWPAIVIKDRLEFFKLRENRLNREIQKAIEYEKAHPGIMIEGPSTGGSYGVFRPIELHISDLKKDQKKFEDKVRSSPFLLIDGNHRSIAFTLAGRPVIAYSLKDDSDIEEIKRMSRRREIPKFPHDYRTLSELVLSFERCALEYLNNTSSLLNVRDNVAGLVEDRDIPDYMARAYRKLNR